MVKEWVRRGENPAIYRLGIGLRAYLAESGRSNLSVGRREPRVMQRIERLGAKLELGALAEGQRELLEERQRRCRRTRRTNGRDGAQRGAYRECRGSHGVQ
jgi:hypothetical protein